MPARREPASPERDSGDARWLCSDQDRLDRVLAALEEGYYRSRDLPTSLGQLLFVAEASDGASVREI